MRVVFTTPRQGWVWGMLRPCPPTKRPNGVISADDDIGPSYDSGDHDGDDDMMILVL